jgi:hypothetical protein
MVQGFEKPVLTGEEAEREVCESETRVGGREGNQDELRPLEDPQLLPQITSASAGVRGHAFRRSAELSGLPIPLSSGNDTTLARNCNQ